MTDQGSWTRTLVMAVVLIGGPGCLSFVHPIHRPEAELRQPVQDLPSCCKDHVFIFLVNGADPLNCTNLTGVRDYLNSLGFHKTYYGQIYHSSYFASEIHQIHQDDPEAKFVLIGFSWGANVVRHLAHLVQKEDIVIDLLVYLGGNTMENIPHDQPENAVRMVNILAQGCIWNGAQLDRAENVQVTHRWHFGSPSHPQTIEILTRELTQVAASVRIVTPVASCEDDDATPRPVMPRTSARRTEWDFLKPVTQLTMPSAEEKTPPLKAEPIARRQEK